MYRVVYASQATRALSPTDITALSLSSRQKNAEAGLTGLLVYHDLRFFQILEGDGEELKRTMTRILRDRRHRNPTLIDVAEIKKRAFVTWRVSFQLPEDLSPPPPSAFCLTDLYPMNSDYRGRDPEVRQHVRDFLVSFRSLPWAAGAG